MSSWHSYSSIFNLGHRAIAELLNRPVIVEEKVDGSQFSFGVHGGEIKLRSKGQEMVIDAPEKMFARAAETVKEIASYLTSGWTYRAEYLQKPKHNALAYARVPDRHLIVFDVETDLCTFLPYAAKAQHCSNIGLECVPLLFEGMLTDSEVLRGLLNTDSVLGSQKIEGVVIKPADYGLFGQDKKVLMGKFVSEAFKEVHKKEWKAANPVGRDVLEMIGLELRTEARWRKAVQHLREVGRLEDSPKDIGALLKEVQADVEKECTQEIQERLFKWAWPQLNRRVVAGLPEWYKQQLLDRQFAPEGGQQ